MKVTKTYKVIEDGIEYDIEEYDNGSKVWLFNDTAHRINGPAMEYADGGKEWYYNGIRHRSNGPAIQTWCGENYWWFYGFAFIKEESYWKKVLECT